MNRKLLATLVLALLAGACKEEAPPPLYEPVAVSRRDISVVAEAAGSVEPILVVDVKSKASGEIMELRAETGDLVRQGELLVAVDPREPRNQVAQAEADLEVARSQLANAEAQKTRSEAMHRQQLVSQQEYEATTLAYANARAQFVRAERALQTVRDQLDDTNVRAPITGTIIQKNVERGQVITSATREVSGGTVLLRMADLSNVQVRTLVDETDIGKIAPGRTATVTVDAYPNQPFSGEVLKIEPQSVVQQNVTMFPVLIRIANADGRLRPGMNAQVQIQIAERPNVLAIPNAALRTQRDVASAAQVLGLDPQDVQARLARADSQRQQQGSMGGTTNGGRDSSGSAQRAAGGGQPAAERQQPQQTAAAPSREGGNMQLPEGVTREMLAEIRRKRQAGEALTPAESTASARMRAMMQGAGGQGREPSGQANAPQQAQQQGGGPNLPPGVSQEQARAIFQKQMSGGRLTAEEQAIMTRIRASMQQGGRGRRAAPNNNFMFGGSYIVFVLRDGQPTPVRIQTGVTDMDYSEVRSGLTERDTVLLLPSASLVASQAEMRDRMKRMAGGGVPGMQQQQPAGGTKAPAPR